MPVTRGLDNSVVLSNFPYFSQLDNKFNPYGSCNVTSVAMCLWYLGIRGDGSQKQLEDQLYQLCIQNGLSRHSPTDLAKLIRLKGRKDNFRTDATFEDVKRHIDKGFPCIVHGWFTRTGHIVVIKGYDDRTFICNDPYGILFENGYDTSVSGENVHYNYIMMRQICANDGQFWLHCVSN